MINRDILSKADYVITLCGDANDNCPMTPSHKTRWHWGFDDPARASGTDEEKWAVFQRVRDEIKQRIKSLRKLENKYKNGILKNLGFRSLLIKLINI